MVLNVAARAVSGPLDIRGDHSDFYYALNTGWIVLCARDPQAVYDLNFAAIRIGEHPDVRLPVMVVYDGFFTSHQKRRIQVFDDEAAMHSFLGQRPEWPTPLDVEHPATFGAYMNDPDLINNKVQLSQAMEAARRVIPEIFGELERMTGRSLCGAGRVPHGRRRRGAGADQLGRRNREGSRRRTARRRQESRRALAQRDAALPFG